ncbi:MAG: hypothetical protein AAB553_07880 [Patescibacteria group bacterium]
MKKETLIILLVAVGVAILASIMYLQNVSKQTEKNNPIAPLIPTWYPEATWEAATTTQEQTPYGEMNGLLITGTTTIDTASIPHFEKAEELQKLGYQPDMALSADGPGSSTWGYSKEQDGKQQIILFSYKTEPTSSNPDEPLQFNCPCTTDLSVFLSN